MAIKLADTLAPMADFPAAMAKDVWFSDNESLQEKFDNGDFSSSGELHGATIAITSTNVEVIGQRVTLSKNGAVVKTRTFNENLMCNFTGIQEAGEYTVGVSVGETLKEKTVTITSDDVLNKTVITVKIQLSNWLQNWIEAGRVTQSFSTLDEVLASEITVRQLMTIHASVDVLKDWMLDDTSVVDTFVANATAMKWMGLRDYAYDTLTSGVDGLEEKILASENWEYALKDHVPKMTSNTAPYGEVTASAVDSPTHDAYKVFDSSYSRDENRWVTQANTSDSSWIQYAFNKPICIKKMMVHEYTDTVWNNEQSNLRNTNVTLLGSNDNADWVDLATFLLDKSNGNTDVYFNVDNNDAYKYYRLSFSGPNGIGTYITIAELQFYGRSLNVSVPKMTSNTAPYGEVTASAVDSPTHDAYKVFDSSYSRDENRWVTQANTSDSSWIQYAFNKPICIKKMMVHEYTDTVWNNEQSNLRNTNVTLLGSNDNADWVDLATFLLDKSNGNTDVYFNVDNNDAYKYYRLSFSGPNGIGTYITIAELQFYGVDYSEREFAEGSTMKYIYDHGIIFNDFIGGLNYVKYINPSESLLEDTYARVGTNTILQTNNMVDLSKYSMLCVKSVLHNPTPTSTNYINVHCIWNVKISTWGQTANSSIREGELKATAQDECGPTVRCLDISSIAKMCVLAMQCGESATTEFTEWWLE